VTNSERPLITGSGTSATLRVAVEALRVRAEALAATVNELIDQGNIRRITVRNGAGHAVLEVPLSAGVVATLVAPAVVAVGHIRSPCRQLDDRGRLLARRRDRHCMIVTTRSGPLGEFGFQGLRLSPEGAV
jgi:hypothetical protein